MALAAAHIENVSADPRRGDRRRVRGLVSQFQIVGLLRRIHIELAIEKQTELVETRPERRSENVSCVLETVYVANFVAVERRNGQFDDPHFFPQELNDDLGIELEIVRVFLERDLSERFR